MKKTILHYVLPGMVFMGLGLCAGYHLLAVFISMEGTDNGEKSRRAPQIVDSKNESGTVAGKRKVTKSTYIDFYRKWNQGMSADAFEKEYSSNNHDPALDYKLKQLLMVEWARQHPESMLAYFDKQWDKKKNNYRGHMYEVLNMCAVFRPEKALAYCMDNAGAGDRFILTDIMKRYAELNPGEAWTQFEKLPLKNQKETIGVFLMGVMSSAEPGKIYDYLDKLNLSARDLDSSVQSYLNGRVFRKLYETDPEQFERWLGNQPEKIRKGAEKQKIFSWAAGGSAQFMEKFSALPLEVRQEFLSQHSYELGEEIGEAVGPEKALDFLKELPGDKKSIAETREAILCYWHIVEWEGFHTWVGNEPDGMVRDEGIMGYVEMMPYIEYEKDMGLLVQIQDENKKLETIKKIARRWSRVSLEKVEKWLKTANLSEEQKEEIAKELDRSRSEGK